MNIKKRSLLTNPTYNKISSIPVSSQILFWTGYFTFNTIKWGSFYSDYAYSFKSNLIEFPFHIGLSYLFIFYLLPKLFNGKVMDFFTLLVISLGLTLVLKFQVQRKILHLDTKNKHLSLIHRYCIIHPFVQKMK